MEGSDAFKAFLWTFKENIRQGRVTGLERIREFADSDCDSDPDCAGMEETRIKDILYIINQDYYFQATPYPSVNFYMTKSGLDKEDKKKYGDDDD